MSERNKDKIVFLCHFSNPDIRERLALKNYRFVNKVLQSLHVQCYNLGDFAVWVSDYIEQFRKYRQYEFHIVAPHIGMKKRREDFQIDGIHYHFYKCNRNVVFDVLNRQFHFDEKSDYQLNRKRIKEIITDIAPKVVCLCGAENPYYSLGVLDLNNTTVFLILQTVLANPKLLAVRGDRIKYRLSKEAEIIRRANYIGYGGQLYYELAHNINPNAVFLHNSFPSHIPPQVEVDKSFDYGFFASWVSKNKGIEDVIDALSIVVKDYPSSKLEIIGRVKADYLEELQKKINILGLDSNVVFYSYFPNQNDMFKQLQSAKCIVIPGITASLNSTVRESMWLCLPTIVYETDSTILINSEKQNLIVARMEDVEDLSDKMKLLHQNPELIKAVAKNGHSYAQVHFDNKEIVDELVNNFSYIIQANPLN